MNKVYQLYSDFENYSFFLEKYDQVNNRFVNKYWGWKAINLNNYELVQYELCTAGNRKRNYQTDISTFSGGLLVFSEKATEALKEILEQNGQLVPIITESKRKKFIGFYPNKNIYDDSIINLEKSEYAQYEKGKVFSKIVLNNNYPKDDYIFTLKSYAMHSFVTEKFKDLVETHSLKGFDFSEYREIKIED